MAIPVLQSVNTTGWQTSNSTDVTKPTNLAVGDLMIAHCVSEGGGFDIPTGFTSLGSAADAQIDSGRHGSVIGYKIANASDVAASNFTFSGSLSRKNLCSIARITGASSVAVSYKYAGSGVANTATPTFAGLTPANYGGGTLMMMYVFGRNNVNSIASYAMATSNPSWIEKFDAGDGGGRAVAMASASRTEVTATGNFSAAGGDGTSDWTGQLVSIPQPNAFSATETISLSESYVRKVWVNISELISTFSRFVISVPRWKNADKSSAATVTNADKHNSTWSDDEKHSSTFTNQTKS